jgi:putative ABC transport system permease protein
LQTFFQELRYTGRALRRAPGFVAVAALSLGFGFGLNTALFSAMVHVLLTPLPFPSPERLVTVWETNERQAIPQVTLSPANFFDVKDSARSFSELGFFSNFRPALRNRDREEEIPAVFVSSDWNALTGARPALGRGFGPEDFAPAAPRVVLLSDGCWRRWFDGDERIVGRAISLDGQAYTAVGVMPPGFVFPYPLVPDPAEAWIPSIDERAGAARKFHGYYVVGRLQPRVRLEAASRELAAIADRLRRQYPATNKNWSFSLVPLQAQLAHDYRRLLFLLGGASCLVLVVACANVNLMWLARILARRREIAVRLALGASAWRIVRELLTESVAVALLGGLLGVAAGAAGQRAIGRFAALHNFVPSSDAFRVDPAAVAGALLIAMIVGVLSGVLPAMHAVRTAARNPGDRLPRHGPKPSYIFGSRGTLSIVQLSLSTALLIAAGVLLESYWRLLHSDFGRRSADIIVARVRPPNARFRDPVQRIAFYSSLLDRVHGLPAAYSGAAISSLALPEGAQLHFKPEQARQADQADELADFYIATPGYFQTIGAVIVRGRDFSAGDARGRAPVVVINQSLARRYWPAEDAIGKRVVVQNMGQEPYTIVGVIKDVDHFNLARVHQPELYFSFFARPLVQMWLVVNAGANGGELFRALQREAWSLDREAAVTSFSSFERMQEKSLSRPQLQTLLVSCLALLALGLSILGVYGVVSYYSAQHVREIAIRLALGATARQVIGLFLSNTVMIVGVSLACGIAISIALDRLLQSFLFGFGAPPISTIAAVSVLLSAVALAATYIPARRSSRLDPAAVLKRE